MAALSLVIFDLAGTVIDDGGAVLNAYRQAFASEQIPVSEPDLQASLGGNKREVVQRFAVQARGSGAATDAVADRVYNCFDRALSQEYREGPLQPVAGANETFKALHAMGLKLATNTGFPATLARLGLGRLGWLEGVFDAQVCGDEVPVGRPAPYMIQLAMQRTGVLSAARVLVTGDTPLDMQAGTNAGAAGVVGVLSGVHGVETLGRVRHTHLLASVAALPELIEREFNYA